MVDELPYGKQAQVDFGEYNMRSPSGTRAKVFFFTMILSRARFKYVWFTDRYFTSELAIIAHEKAFEYIESVPDEIVYDQDKVFIVSENGGDIILTAAAFAVVVVVFSWVLLLLFSFVLEDVFVALVIVFILPLPSSITMGFDGSIGS